MNVTLKDGFVLEVADDAADNMELVDALADTQDEDPLAMSRVCLLVLGKTQRKALYDHLRCEDGRVPVAAVNDVLTEIFAALGGAGKNS